MSTLKHITIESPTTQYIYTSRLASPQGLKFSSLILGLQCPDGFVAPSFYFQIQVTSLVPMRLCSFIACLTWLAGWLIRALIECVWRWGHERFTLTIWQHLNELIYDSANTDCRMTSRPQTALVYGSGGERSASLSGHIGFQLLKSKATSKIKINLVVIILLSSPTCRSRILRWMI